MTLDRRRAAAEPSPARFLRDECPGWASRLICLAKANGVFALSEISKGVAIVMIGDMVIADELGELISAVALTMGARLPGA
jgi:hypothetical protein